MKRASGVLLHISSLPGAYSHGAFGDPAKRWIDRLSENGFTWWQVLPFCLPDECNSPYKSYSAFSINPYFIDLKQLADAGLLTPEELKNAQQNTPFICEFSRLKRERLALLAAAADRFTDDAALNAFLAAHPHTAHFCTFMALKHANGEREWQTWTTDEPDPGALRLWQFTQYEAFIQWQAIRDYAKENGVKIIGDLPIYVSLDSADVWADPEQFLLDDDRYPACVAGVPPDYFSADGQLWGNPLYDWEKMKADGYRWWTERMAFMTELFDGVRIDHFRGFESYYSIPAEEKTAKNGVWKKGPGLELIETLKAACGDMLLIAEDLGDVTEAVHKLVADSGCPGMRVLQFAFLGDPDSPHMPHNYTNNSVAYTGTHDNNTLLGFVWGMDEGSRRYMLQYFGYDNPNWDRCYDTLLSGMFRSHAGLLILPVQDLLLYGSDTRLNRPGTVEDNWNYRVTEDQLRQINWEKFRRWNILFAREKNK
ncbi:MAG: 4-alpha-glucanotransferase [Clostridia bacterium]|nr:4-alpha-glucanotransferase [Clostridia bacterium]